MRFKTLRFKEKNKGLKNNNLCRIIIAPQKVELIPGQTLFVNETPKITHATTTIEGALPNIKKNNPKLYFRRCTSAITRSKQKSLKNRLSNRLNRGSVRSL